MIGVDPASYGQSPAKDLDHYDIKIFNKFFLLFFLLKRETALEAHTFSPQLTSSTYLSTQDKPTHLGGFLKLSSTGVITKDDITKARHVFIANYTCVLVLSQRAYVFRLKGRHWGNPSRYMFQAKGTLII